MKKDYTKTTINMDRANNDVEKMMNRAIEMKEFTEKKQLILNSEKKDIVEFFAKMGVKELMMTNFYSTGRGEETHKADSSMRGTIYFEFHPGKEPKNLELWAARVNEKYKNTFLRTRLSVEKYKSMNRMMGNTMQVIHANIWF